MSTSHNEHGVEDETEVVQAKYVIGADGEQLGPVETSHLS